MSTKYDVMKSVINKCDIRFDNSWISHELLLQTFAHFINESSKEEGHSVAIALHTGSILFDAIAVAYAAISNMLLDESDSIGLLRSLNIGDTVIYKDSRYSFNGFGISPSSSALSKTRPAPETQLSDHECVMLSGKGGISYVPKTMWRLIIPYQGSSKTYDGRGVRKTSGIREEFYYRVLGIDQADIPSVINTSTVIAVSRERASRLVNNISFFFEGKEVGLLELITASYFTENEEYYFAGNSGKNEPVLKFCGSVSRARQLLLDDCSNKNVGLIVLGSDIVSRGISELPMLLKRKSIQSVLISMPVDSEYGPVIFAEYDKAALFACTKEFLLSNSLATKAENEYTRELAKQVDAIVDRQCKPIILPSFLGWKEYRQFKRNMLTIKNSELDSPEKNSFVIQAYSLMNLFVTAVFNIQSMERLIEQGVISVVSPSERLEMLLSASLSFPPHLKESADNVRNIIETAYLFLSEKSTKEEYLRQHLTEIHDHRVALIVPKAYFVDIIRDIGLSSVMDSDSLLEVSTANRFNNDKVYDEIICVGDIEGKRFNPFRCKGSRNITPILHDFESGVFNHKYVQARKVDEYLDSHSMEGYVPDYSYEDIYTDSNVSEGEIIEAGKIDSELDEYVRSLCELEDLKYIGTSQSSGTLASIVAIGTFETGHKAFFSQMYKAYVFDELNEEVVEKSVNELCEGDSIVFTKNNDDTRDIVDELLSKLINEKKYDSEVRRSYDMSKAWKRVLITYMNRTCMTPRGIAKALIDNGVTVQEITIRGWLDEDAHTVGPRDASSIQQIAFLAEDEEMYEHFEEYYLACNRIRKIRRKLLRMIGEAIIQNISGKELEEGTLLAEVSGRIQSLAMILRLDSISYVSRTIPINAINKPLLIKE